MAYDQESASDTDFFSKLPKTQGRLLTVPVTFCVSVFPTADCGHIRQVASASRV